MTRSSRTAVALAISLLGLAILAPASGVAGSSASTARTQPGATAQFERASDEIATLSPSSRRAHPAAGESSGRVAVHGAGASAASARPMPATVAKTSAAAPQKVYVSVVSATSKTSDDVNKSMTEAAVKKVVAYASSYWSAQSGGAVTFAFAGYETRSIGEQSCNASDVLATEESDAFDGRFSDHAWIGSNEHLLILSRESCGAQSFATVSDGDGEIFSGNGIGSAMGEPYLLHEFGHNLGFAHADGSICESTRTYDAELSSYGFTSTTCPTTEYDDYLDIMGYTVRGATPNVSSVQRILAGWMTNYASVDGGAGRHTITLKPLGATGGTQAIVVTDPVSGEDYYVEYRAPVRRDTTSAEFNYKLQCGGAHGGYSICNLGSSATYGVVRILRALPVDGAFGTTALAVARVSGSSAHRATRLSAGLTFANFDGGFTVKVNSLSISRGASITVTLLK